MSVEDYIANLERELSDPNPPGYVQRLVLVGASIPAGGWPGVKVSRLTCHACGESVLRPVAIELGLIIDDQFYCGCRWTPGRTG